MPRRRCWSDCWPNIALTGARSTDKRGAAPDALILGGGVIGLAIAWRAGLRGLRVTVLEADRPGRGSSHAAAGMLAPVTEAAFGEEELLALNLEAARTFPVFAHELESDTGHTVDYLRSGALTVAVDRDQLEELERLNEFQRSLGLDAEWVSARECRRLEPGLAPRIAGGIHAPGDHQVSPRALVAALEVAAQRAGADIRTGAAAASLVVAHDRVDGVELESGERMAAGAVVVAAGAGSGTLGGLPPEARVPIRPVKGQIARLRGRPGQVATRVIRTPEMYAVPRADGRLVVGATVEERGFDRTVTAGAMLDILRHAYQALPGVFELELVEMSAGLRPTAPDNEPVVGPGGMEGLHWATGHWRNGILLAPVTADAVAGALAGEPMPGSFAHHSPARFTAGGPAGDGPAAPARQAVVEAG